jgi:hypothetical protein
MSVLDIGVTSLKSQTLCRTFSIVNTVKKPVFQKELFPSVSEEKALQSVRDLSETLARSTNKSVAFL